MRAEPRTILEPGNAAGFHALLTTAAMLRPTAFVIAFQIQRRYTSAILLDACRRNLVADGYDTPEPVIL